MENICYSRTIKAAVKSPDGETPTMVRVTKEVNGFAVFYSSFEVGNMLVLWNTNRDKTIEFAVSTEETEFVKICAALNDMEAE